MTQVSQATWRDAEAFCGLCQWIYECWATHKNLFECLPDLLEDQRGVSIKNFVESSYGQRLACLNEISMEYVILKIATLHDPAKQGRNENLSINFFVEQEELWSEQEKLDIQDIATELAKLYQKINDLRNKILVHNDRLVFAKGQSLGSFMEGDDESYFLSLGKLCTIIWTKFPSPGWPYEPRTFEFTKSGIPMDSFCPSNAARKLSKLIVEAYPESAESNS